jgi:crotonobetainyl-CoA:carnitine CoA-transferase CaiB-like acyl-CoA transferase
MSPAAAAASSPLPWLADVVVLDFTQYLAGPLCTGILAALGADVVKIERPGHGDSNRHHPPYATSHGPDPWREAPDDTSLSFLKRNIGKRSCAIDLKSPAGRALLEQLAVRADVVVHNFRPGVPARLGLDAASLRALNPDVVLCEMSGLGGYAGPEDMRGVVDIVGQAIAGAMAITGDPHGDPTRFGAPIADQAAGLYAAIGVLGALVGQRCGRAEPAGSVLSVSMVGALSSLVWDEHLDVYHRPGQPSRHGNETPRNAPFNAYRARDGKYVAVAALNANEWACIVEATGIEAFRSRPEWSDTPARVRDREEIDRLLGEWMAERSRDEAVARLATRGVTVGPVLDVDDMLEEPRYRDSFLSRLEDPTHGLLEVMTPNFPITAADGPAWPQGRRAPALGEHTRDVLAEYCGLTDEEIARLEAEGVTQTAKARP